MRQAAKRDISEPAIVDALEATGWTVTRLSMKDGPDLLIGRAGVTELVECKTGRKKVRPGQGEWHARWRGRPVRVMRNSLDVELLNADGEA